MKLMLVAAAAMHILACTSSPPKNEYPERKPAGQGEGDPAENDDSGSPGRPEGGVSSVADDSDDAGEENTSFEAFTEGMALGFDLTLAQPKKWQVFQRKTKTVGQVSFSFELPADPADGRKPSFVRVRIPGEAGWKTMKLEKTSGAVTLGFDFPAGGFYDLEVIVYDQAAKILSRTIAEKVGVGEVFVVAGQSNSTNCGDTVMVPESGKVSSTDGLTWKEGRDPQIGTHDAQVPGCNKGSNWPVTGDLLAKKLGVPVAFASTGYSGTSISQWLPGGDPRDLFGYTLKRIKDIGAGNFRAVLWHQGENDAYLRTTEEVYFSNLKTVIEESRSQSGWSDMPWLVAQATFCADYHYDRPWGAWEPVRQAQARAASLPSVFAGPDTDDLRGQHRANNDTNCHFSRTGLTAVGERWADKILTFLDVR